MDDACMVAKISKIRATAAAVIIVACVCGCSSMRLSACAEHMVGVFRSFSIAGTPN
jgi:hypothetical protein